MQKVHNCDKGPQESVVFYDEVSNTWWLALTFSSTAIKYCPFCGVELQEGQGGMLLRSTHHEVALCR